MAATAPVGRIRALNDGVIYELAPMPPEAAAAATDLSRALPIGARVSIDDNSSLTFIVTGVLMRRSQFEYEISWLSDGDQKCAWIAHWRVKKFRS